MCIRDRDRTVVPLRAVSEAFDCRVDWIEELDRVVTVSYTHLDVYKRQEFDGVVPNIYNANEKYKVKKYEDLQEKTETWYYLSLIHI